MIQKLTELLGPPNTTLDRRSQRQRAIPDLTYITYTWRGKTHTERTAAREICRERALGYNQEDDNTWTISYDELTLGTINDAWAEVTLLQADREVQLRINSAYYDRHKRIDEELQEKRQRIDQQLADFDDKIAEILGEKVFLLENGNALIPVLGYDMDINITEVTIYNVPDRSDE